MNILPDAERARADEIFGVLREEIKPLIDKYFGHTTISRKGDDVNDVFTEADVALQELVITRIKERFPGEGIVAEELAAQIPSENGYTWYIDPIDGTRNFSTGVPIFGVLVARAYEDEILSAINYMPMFDEFFVAHRGCGATLNGMKISASRCTDFKTSYGLGYVRQGGKKSEQFQTALTSMAPDGVWVNSFGSVAYSSALASDGRRDWYFSTGANVWDYAAPALIARESGCLTLNAQGEAWRLADRSLVIAAPGIEVDIKKLLSLL